jgi:hypothetical protein
MSVVRGGIGLASPAVEIAAGWLKPETAVEAGGARWARSRSASWIDTW